MALALGVLAVAARALAVVLYEAQLDLAPFRDALQTALASGQLALARTLSESCLPAFGARLSLCGVAALERGQPVGPALDELRLSLEHRLDRGVQPLRTMGRMATPLAFVTIIVELGYAGSDRGLRALQRGLPLRLSLDHGLDALALGVSTLLVAGAALSIVLRGARSLRQQLAGVSRTLEEAAAPRFTPPRDAV